MASWNVIPDVIKGIFVGKNLYNKLQQNVRDWTIEALNNWHFIDTDTDSQAEFQGVSRQLYTPKGTGIAIKTGVDDYGGLTGWITIDEAIPAVSNNVITLDTVNEWRERIIEGHLIFADAAVVQNPLPTQANDATSGYYSELLGAAIVTTNITDALLSMSYTRDGFAVPPTAAAADKALFTNPTGPTQFWIYADNTGNLKAKILNTGGVTRFVQIYGRISASPQYPV